ncbi:MAG: acyl--CoA ligase [Tardiphaga sp.]|nr:acyl--CoA ligase [Tardiphaga sp.]
MPHASSPESPALADATLRGWVGKWAEQSAGSSALCSGAETINFAGLHERAMALAGFFGGLGLKRGDVIAAQLPNGVEFVLTLLAASYIGAVLQTIHMPYRAAEIEPLLAHSKAKAVVCLGRLKDFSPAEFIVSLRPRMPGLQHVIAVGEGHGSSAHPFPDGHVSPDAPAFKRPVAADLFLLLYTSGTTAAPKGVPIAYRKFLPNAALSARELNIDDTSVLLSAAPFTHLYGLFSLNLAFSAGATTALLPAYSPALLADALDRHRPTGLFVAPAHMTACLNEGLLTRERLASLRFVLISGSYCPPELAQSVQDLMPNGDVLQLWGMSELQAGSFTRPGDDPRARFTTTGRASPNTELRVTLDNQSVSSNTEGELEVRGRSLFDGYLDNPDDTSRAFTEDGWFRTGDLALIDEAGNVQLTGRLKDVINRGGVKFNPADAEALIARHPDVASCAIVPAPDAVLGERACCFVVLKDRANSLRLEDLCDWLRTHNVGKLKWPERLEVIDEMPMTPTRKVMKGELARRLSQPNGPLV